ncbi:MAG: ferrochelatase [Taibaiella sp.]|nr:ferrochelatase [Taibaiella sp.]
MATSKSKRGIILMNLGSPDSTSVSDVRRYLNEFLMDERVIDSPWLVRTLLVKGIITPFRAPKSAEAYESIWTKNGSPLVHITSELSERVAERTGLPTVMAMRYGTPTMETAYKQLLEIAPDVEDVVLLPLYPHYAMSSYETAVEHAKTYHKKGGYRFKISFVPPFYDHPAFIDALAESMRPAVSGNPAHILFSYHSIPERHIQKSDVTGTHCLKSADCCSANSEAHKYCYRHQCYVTTKLVAEKLGLPKERYSVSFQSKLGRSAWLTPATTARMNEMPAEGTKDLIVVCPSFVSDCLETLEEIAIREKENFMNAGGNTYQYIPCMNTDPVWVDAVVSLIGQ